MVEVKGVEPLSEHIVIRISPSADSILGFAFTTPADRLCNRYSVVLTGTYGRQYPAIPLNVVLSAPAGAGLAERVT